MERHHTIALVGATLTSAIALGDAVTHGLTGDYSIFSDEGTLPWPLIGDVVHGLTYAALAWVLIHEMRRFREANRVARTMRLVLVVAFAGLAVGFIAVSPALWLVELPNGGLAGTWGIVAMVLFAAMILGSLVLGVAVWRRNPIGVGGRVLAVLPAVVLATVALAILVPDWAHPAYAEATINFGVALIGVGAAATANASALGRRGPASVAAAA